MAVGSILLVSSLVPLLSLALQLPAQTFTAITVDGVRIQYDVIKKIDTSENAPLVVLLHGFSGNRIMMRMIAYALASEGLICVPVDLRGHGSSEGILESIDKFNQDVQAVIQSLEAQGIGNTKRIVLIGHSMGGGVTLASPTYSTSTIATIGIAPVASPEWVNTTIPANLLLVIATGDSVINATTVKQTFYKSVNGTLSFNTLHTMTGTSRELYVVDGSDHLNILYDETAIREIVKWVTRSVFGVDHNLAISTLTIQTAVYLSIVGGTIVIITGLAFVHWRITRARIAPIEVHDDEQKPNLKELIKISLFTIVITSVSGPLIAGLVGALLNVVSPLIFSNFIAALFLGNAVSFILVAWIQFRRRYPRVGYRKFVLTSLKASSLRIDLSLGIVGAIAFLILLAFTLGSQLTASYSTGSIRINMLPVYIMSFITTFFFFESLFIGVTRPLMGSGTAQILYSVIFESGLLYGTFILEMFIVSTVLSVITPIIRLEFFLLGLNLLLLPLVISRVSAVNLYVTTRGWIAQIIISALIFASLTIVFSPIIQSF